MFDDQETVESSTINPLQEAALNARRRYREGISLASGLLAKDALLVCVVYIVLVTPAVVSSIIPTLTTNTVILLSAVERLIYAHFFYLILRKWFKAFSLPSRTVGPQSYLVIMAVHGVFWMIMTLPVVAQGFGLPEAVDLFAVGLLFPLTFITLRYYFYFVPVMMGVTKPSQILKQADLFTTHHRFLPIKILIPPLVASTLYSGLITGFSPDVRHTSVALLLDAGDGIFWVLSSYLSLGVGFTILSKSRSLTSELDPYLDARLETLRLHSPAWLTGLLHPGHAGKLVLVAMLIWTGNMIRMWELSPSPSISLETVKYDGTGKVMIELDLKDENHSFRGFRPVLFRIAGESGEPLSASPSQAFTAKGEKDLLYYFPRHSTETKLTLNFELLSRADDFNLLSDVHLWYAHAKIAHIDPSKIVLVPVSPTVAKEVVQ